MWCRDRIAGRTGSSLWASRQAVVQLLTIVSFFANGILETHGFLLDDVCLAPPPCDCSLSAVDCGGKDLTDIPAFLEDPHLSPALDTLDIYLNSNDLTFIDAHAFVGLATTNASVISIHLHDNSIYELDPDAFLGIEDDVVLVNLQANNLSVIPQTLERLHNLHTLYLQDNPLRSLASPAIYHLSRILTTLSVSMDLFSEWPLELQYFQFLTELTTSGFPLPRLPLNAMLGLEKRLEVLTISNTKLDRLPAVICHLRVLKTLHYTSNNSTRSPVFETCNNTIITLTTLDMRLNSLERVPNIFSSFPSLTILNLQSNRIRIMDSSMATLELTESYPLQFLDLSDNDLQAIPSAILKLHFLDSLHLENNNIQSIEDNAFEGLIYLTHLSLANNPLEYVSSVAFKSQKTLGYFYFMSFEDTRLRAIPRALHALDYVTRLVLDGTPIDCTCAMDYLRNWYTSQTDISGICERTLETVEYFLVTYLPLCP